VHALLGGSLLCFSAICLLFEHAQNVCDYSIHLAPRRSVKYLRRQSARRYALIRRANGKQLAGRIPSVKQVVNSEFNSDSTY